MAFEIGTKNCIECESENSPKKGITAVQNPINPRAFSKRGKPIRGERLTVLCHMEHCDSTAAHLRDQSDDVCVLELKEGKKIEVKLNFFHRFAHVFQSSPTTSWFYRDARCRFG